MKIKSNYQYYFLTALFCFLLFFIDFIDILPIAGYQKFILNWKEKNYQLVQQTLKPVHRFNYLWNLTNRLEDLQYRYAESSAQLSQLQALEKENQELRKMLENTDRKFDQSLITAPIISFSQAVVAVGREDGIRENSAVLFDNNLLGFLRDVESNQARVELLSQMTERGVLAVTESGVKGLIKGNGRLILLTEVSSEERLELNELVMTAGQEGVEKGIFIGRIRNIKIDNPAKSTQVAEIEQLLNFYELSLLEIK